MYPFTLSLYKGVNMPDQGLAVQVNRKVARYVQYHGCGG